MNSIQFGAIMRLPGSYAQKHTSTAKVDMMGLQRQLIQNARAAGISDTVVLGTGGDSMTLVNGDEARLLHAVHQARTDNSINDEMVMYLNHSVVGGPFSVLSVKTTEEPPETSGGNRFPSIH